MDYTPIQFMRPLIEFLQTCPLLTFADGADDIHGFPFSPNVIEGGGLAYTGTPRPNRVRDVMGDIRITKQANFIFYIQRTWVDAINHEEMSDFMAQFEEWVEREDILGRTPKFGGKDFDEQLWADSGMFLEIQSAAQPFTALYMIQLHVQYQKLFIMEEDY